MNRRFHTPLILILAAGLTFGCATREETGTLVGAAAGGAIGSTVGGGHGRILAIIVGAAIGSAVGAEIGRYMDDEDRVRVAESLEYHRTGERSTWVNPDTGYRYAVTPTRTWERDEGPCREFTLSGDIGGREQPLYGTACRQPDGSWRIVS